MSLLAIDIPAFLNTLPIMGYGMLGIFAVTVVIILVMTLLGKIPEKKDK